MTTAGCNCADIEQKALAIVSGNNRFRIYTHGRTFKELTDHSPLTAIFNPKRATNSVAAAHQMLVMVEVSV